MDANEMRTLSAMAMDSNETLQKFYNKATEKIRQAALSGKRELCFYDVCHPCDKGYSPNVRSMLISKLSSKGFSVKKGSQLGKGMGSWETPYIVW